MTHHQAKRIARRPRRAAKTILAVAATNAIAAAQPSTQSAPQAQDNTPAQPSDTTPPTRPDLADPIIRRNRDDADRPVPFTRPPEGKPNPAEGITFPVIAFQAESSSVFRSNADLDGTSTGYALLATKAEVSTLYVASPALTLSGSLAVEYAAYDFDADAPLLPGDPASADPFESVQTYTLGLTSIIRTDPQTTFIVGGSVNASYEAGADFNDAIGGQLIAGATYAFSDTLTLGLGVNFIYDLDGQPNAIPLPFVEWRFAERWELASGARGINLTYEQSDRLTLGIGARFLGREFRLDDEGTLPGGLAEDNAVAVAAFFEWDITSELTLELALGAEVFRRLELRDASDTIVFDDNAETALVAAGRLTFRF